LYSILSDKKNATVTFLQSSSVDLDYLSLLHFFPQVLATKQNRCILFRHIYFIFCHLIFHENKERTSSPFTAPLFLIDQFAASQRFPYKNC
jgi:hypothetical protein